MMRTFGGLVVAALATMLSACGSDGDSFAVKVNRSPANVAAPLLMASISDATLLVPGLKAVRSRPSDNELKFTFPGDGKYEPATILFQFEAADGGKATTVKTTLDVPRVIAKIDGETKVLSEKRLSQQVRRVIEGMAKGDSAERTTTQLSGILAAMAISTDGRLRDRAMATLKSPSAMMRQLIESTGGDGPRDQLAMADDNDPTEYDTPRDESEQFSPERESEPVDFADSSGE